MPNDHEVHGCGAGCGEQGHHHGHHHDAVAGPGDELVVCAVRGNTTTRSQAEADGPVRDHEGQRYYFCCAHCAATFDADPLAYAAVR